MAHHSTTAGELHVVGSGVVATQNGGDNGVIGGATSVLEAYRCKNRRRAAI